MVEQPKQVKTKKDWQGFITEGSIVIALLISIIATVAIVVISGADSLPATGLRDISLALVGALAGTKIPR